MDPKPFGPEHRGSRIERVEVSVFRIPTDRPESDGTLTWDSTTLVVVHVSAGGQTGLGYTYASAAVRPIITELLADAVVGMHAMAIPAAHEAMVQAVRNQGRPGISSMAIAAVDSALWDLKARILGLPLVTLLGAARAGVPVYGSGGFTSYSVEELKEQLGAFAAAGMGRVKMKIGRDAEADGRRVAKVRKTIGENVELFVDANGAYSRKQALAQAEIFADFDVRWFEEPVSSDDLDGLRLIRDRAPAGMDIAAGEYGYDLPYFQRMLDAGAVDVLQADATRCAGITGFLKVAALCEARGLRLSAHCGPSLHAHPCCAAVAVCHLEYFHDHARIERMLFDGALAPVRGSLWPDLSRPGMGIELKRADGARYAI